MEPDREVFALVAFVVFGKAFLLATCRVAHIIPCAMTRLFFVCPKTGKRSSFLFDNPPGKKVKCVFDVICTQCGGAHFLPPAMLQVSKQKLKARLFFR
jgi:hypothetical protein